MNTNLQKWGNSLGLRIPSSLTRQLNLHEGSLVNIVLEDRHLVIYPQAYSLKEFLDQITENNQHDHVWEKSNPEGKEEW
jgi:antitoxin MazE